jgi:tubulin polyglutamylase TTLL6/13
MMMHLTNYAINKDSDGFVFNQDPNRDDIGHKRSIKAVFRQIDEVRAALARQDSEAKPLPSSEEIWAGIKDIIVKTLLTGQPALAHSYRSAKPDDLENSMCF